MNAVLYRIVLRRQTESIPAHGMYKVIAVQHLIPAPYIGDDISSPVSHMQSRARRVREHVKAVILGFLPVVNIYGMLLPVFSPLFFNLSVIVLNCHFYILLSLVFYIKTDHTIILFNDFFVKPRRTPPQISRSPSHPCNTCRH